MSKEDLADEQTTDIDGDTVDIDRYSFVQMITILIKNFQNICIFLNLNFFQIL